MIILAATISTRRDDSQHPSPAPPRLVAVQFQQGSATKASLNYPKPCVNLITQRVPELWKIP